MQKPRPYRKLASAHQFGVVQGGWVSLHLGSDHLLLRASSGFTETYRRFYFSDIEAITICRTMRRIFTSAVCGLALIFSLLPIVVNRGSHPVAWSFTALFALLLLVNLLRGPTCRTELQTRVQTRPLPLRRLRKAARIAEQIAAQVSAAQADIVMADPNAAAPAQPVAPIVRDGPGVPPPLPGEAPAGVTWLHLALSALLIATAVLALIGALQPDNTVVPYFIYAGILLNAVMSVAVLVKQRGRGVAPGLSPIVWTSVIAHGFVAPSVYMVYAFVHSFRNVDFAAQTEPPPTLQFPLSTLRALPGFTEVLAVYGLFALLIGLLAALLFVVRRVRRVDSPRT
jgi:hypothetical protein